LDIAATALDTACGSFLLMLGVLTPAVAEPPTTLPEASLVTVTLDSCGVLPAAPETTVRLPAASR